MSTPSAPTSASSPPDLPRRAGRPPRLRREAVISEAIALVDDEGLGALSMPKLARRLGVGTMTLYGYVTGKDDLLSRMASSMLESVRLADSDSGAWHDRVRRHFRALRAVALEHPALAALLTAGQPDAVALAGDLEPLLGAVPADVDRSEAGRTLLATLAFTIGTISREASSSNAAPGDELFEWGLDALLPTP